MSHNQYTPQPSAPKCRECRRPATHGRLCWHHNEAEWHRREFAFFQGFHATDERMAEWLGVTVHAVERFRERSM